MFSEHFQHKEADAVSPLIEPEFAFFQKIGTYVLQLPQTKQTGLGKSPKTFSSIDLDVVIGRFIMGIRDVNVFLLPKSTIPS